MRRYGRGSKKAGTMNLLERKYADRLETKRQIGSVIWYTFDALNFRLAQKTYYRPDFIVMTADNSIEVHEVKGFWEDDALVKIKVAAELYPFRFLAVTWDRKNRDWNVREF